jgi:hypothetical protein
LKALSEPATPKAFIAPPTCCNFLSVTAASDDRTFVAAASHGRGTSFYELRLGRTGVPKPLVRLSFTIPGLVRPTGLALAPDGRHLAAITNRGRNWDAVSVIATATGATRTWNWRAPAPKFGLGPEFPSWSGDHAIDFVINQDKSGPELVRLSTSAPDRESAFRVHAIGFSQLATLAKWSPWRVDGMSVAADGRIAFAAVTGGRGISPSGAAVPVRATLVRMSATTGKPLQVLTRPWATPVGNSDYSCGVLWTDASGRHFLYVCGSTAGRVDDGRFAPIDHLQPAPHVPFSGSIFAW